ncbi:MAG: AbrB/MazE/SpoVT family DNA-binding domain-containing protein [Gemmatimonadota bacterium]|nr:AbrB/MazE/SpoVT family DNA-binding domain-containing protein [Gemmatimonadota bacterium]
MIVKITSKRQITLPVGVLDALGVRPGDRLEIVEAADGFALKPRRINHSRVGTLHDKIRRGQGTFDLQEIREQSHDPSLRD